MIEKRIIEDYYDAWTVDGIDDYHTDAEAAHMWLQDRDIWTADDEKKLGDMTPDELRELAEDIAEMAKDQLAEEKQ